MGNKGGKKNKRYNRYDLTGEYGIGYTNHGVEFYFDLEDYDKIKKYCWVLSKTTDTIVARIPDSNNKLITLHRLVMDAPPEVHVDHIHHNRHDNRKSELRICTPQENNFNRGPCITNTSGVVGVSWDAKDDLWHAYIGKDGKRINKYFHKDEFEQAVAWRKAMEKELFGEFAYNE